MASLFHEHYNYSSWCLIKGHTAQVSTVNLTCARLVCTVDQKEACSIHTHLYMLIKKTNLAVIKHIPSTPYSSHHHLGLRIYHQHSSIPRHMVSHQSNNDFDYEL